MDSPLDDEAVSTDRARQGARVQRPRSGQDAVVLAGSALAACPAARAAAAGDEHPERRRRAAGGPGRQRSHRCARRGLRHAGGRPVCGAALAARAPGRLRAPRRRRGGQHLPGRRHPRTPAQRDPGPAPRAGGLAAPDHVRTSRVLPEGARRRGGPRRQRHRAHGDLAARGRRDRHRRPAVPVRGGALGAAGRAGGDRRVAPRHRRPGEPPRDPPGACRLAAQARRQLLGRPAHQPRRGRRAAPHGTGRAADRTVATAPERVLRGLRQGTGAAGDPRSGHPDGAGAGGLAHAAGPAAPCPAGRADARRTGGAHLRPGDACAPLPRA